jgi:hypothetical protein
MFGSKSDHGRLFPIADLKHSDDRVAQAGIRANRLSFEKLQRFPPIEDLVVSLDTIASRAAAA